MTIARAPWRSVLALVVIMAAGSSQAAVYPVNKCVSTKQKEAATYCKSALKAWAKWFQSQNDSMRDAELLKAGDKLAQKWAKAEETSAKKGSDCVDATLGAAAARSLLDAAVADVANDIASGLALGNTPDGKCGRKLLLAASLKCDALLKAQSKHILNPAKDADATKLGEATAKASAKFSSSWQKVASCPTAASEAGVEAEIDALSEDVVLQTIVSPNVDPNGYETVSPTGTTQYGKLDITPGCIFGTPYHFFARRGSVNKLVVYYQGGGACWEQLTCGIPVCDASVNPAGSDNPNNYTTGFVDLSNPDNPFRDWNAVFVSYCSCDVHYGDAAQDYDNVNPASPLHVEHRGFHNAKIVEKWAREHFLNPEEIFVTGSSAGAYGAVFNAPGLHEVWPASQIRVLGDAGNGVITASFLQNEFNNWGFQKNLPEEIPGLIEAINSGSGFRGYMEAVGDYFPDTLWAHYTSAFDGGTGGQTGFYNVMLNGNNPAAALTWWEGSCAFNQVMRQQAFDTAAALPTNYRYYIGSGSQHTMWGSDKVYTDTLGGVPTIRDWLSAMLASSAAAPDAGWVNVEASPFNVLLPGNPQPAVIPTAPFEMSGTDIVVNCP